ncbi:MAG: tyrosine recombinase [Acutalibacteraceae bacterium]|nr:tyrosine recombinase [Acutalibacteraceae bacterium]
MTDYIVAYKVYLLNVKKSSANTVESYIRDVHQYSEYCSSLGKSAEKMKPDNFHGYFDYLTALGKSEATQTRILASIRCFYKFMISEGYCKENPADTVKIKRTEKKLPGILDSNEILLLLSQPDGTDYKSRRDKAMLELLYATGIKVSELIDLTVSNINLQIGILHLHNEKKERIVPMYPAAVKAISNYLVNVRPVIVTDETEDRLFTNMNGKPMSRQGFWKIIKHYAEKAGIKKDITPHTLRHSFAAHLLENGAQLKDIKEMLGHSDISSTQVYAQFIKNKYTMAYAKYHPLAK